MPCLQAHFSPPVAFDESHRKFFLTTAVILSGDTLILAPKRENTMRYRSPNEGGSHDHVILAALRKLNVMANSLASAVHLAELTAPTRA